MKFVLGTDCTRYVKWNKDKQCTYVNKKKKDVVRTMGYSSPLEYDNENGYIEF